MRNSSRAGVRKVVLPTLACSLVCGGAVVALAATGVHALEVSPTVQQARLPAVPAPAAVVVRTPPTPEVTDAPTAPEWVVRLPAVGP